MIMENPDFRFEKIKRIESFEDIGRIFDNDHVSLPADRETLMSLGHDITVLLNTHKGEVRFGDEIQNLFYFIVASAGDNLNEEQSYFKEETLGQLENFLQSIE